MPGYRVLVADTRHAKIFEMETPRAPLRFLEAIENPHAGKHERDLVSDAPGRLMTRSGGGARSASLTPRSSQKEHAMTRFARLLARRMSSEARADKDAGLVLVAAPRLDLQRRVAAAVRPTGVSASPRPRR